jgi:hypothetical protein
MTRFKPLDLCCGAADSTFARRRQFLNCRRCSPPPARCR